MAVEYKWDEIKDVKVDEKGVKVTLKGESEYPVPAEKYPMPLKSEPKPVATDSVKIVLDESTFVVDDDGTLVIPDVVIAKEMVQDYEGKEGGVWKSGEEIQALVRFLDNRPITDGHPEIGYVTSPDEVKGACVNTRCVDSSAVTDLRISDKQLIEDVQSGKKREVSLGFQCDWVEEPGKFGELDYAWVQKKIYPDHTAMVRDGRCSLTDGCGVTDKVLLQAKTIVDEHRKQIIDEIASRSDVKSREDLEKDSIEDLTKSLALVKQLQAEAGKPAKIKSKAASDEDDLHRKVDDAYAKI